MMKKKSGPAIFMDCIIGASVLIATVCFSLYYGHIFSVAPVLWLGIVAFMIVYHLWFRLLLGSLTKRFRVNPNSAWFREKPFEKRLYRALKVKHWKGKALTYNPDQFSVKTRTMDEIVDATVKAELDHWLNEGLSLTSILFSLLWGETWIFILTAVLAMLFDGQFILIQRYNRPRLRMLSLRMRNGKIQGIESCKEELGMIQ